MAQLAARLDPKFCPKNAYIDIFATFATKCRKSIFEAKILFFCVPATQRTED